MECGKESHVTPDLGIPKRIFFWIVAFLFLFPIPAEVQEQRSIIVGGIPVTIGMKKDDVLAKYKKDRFELSAIKDDAWFIMPSGKDNAASRALGVLQFKDGLLYSASRAWTQSEHAEALRLFDNLFAALRPLADENGKPIVLQTYEMNQPRLFHKSIEFHFDTRIVTVSITTGEKVAGQVEINERVK
jgi:hypothetical protein